MYKQNKNTICIAINWLPKGTVKAGQQSVWAPMHLYGEHLQNDSTEIKNIRKIKQTNKNYTTTKQGSSFRSCSIFAIVKIIVRAVKRNIFLCVRLHSSQAMSQT